MGKDIFDNLPIVSNDKFNEFRQRRFNFTYYCKNCVRSFDMENSTDRCKFCGQSNILEIRSVLREESRMPGPSRIKFRYFCASCEKNFISYDSLSICSNCRSLFLHVYTWDRLRRRDKLYIKLQKSLRRPFEQKSSVQKKNGTYSSVGNVFKKFSRDDEEMPSY
jgi:rRNA maturation endonuclease Nob1